MRERGRGLVYDDPRQDSSDRVAVRFAAAPPQAGAMTRNRDVYSSPRRDQERSNGCVGQSGRLAQQIAEALVRHRNGDDPRDTPEYSAMFPWYNARPDTDKGLNVGCQIRDHVAMVKRYGLCLEIEWPFEAVEGDYTKRLTQRPSAEAYEQAQRHQLLDAYRVPDGDIGGVQAALAAGHPMQFGFPVYDSFFDTEHTGGLVRYPWAGKFAGLHAMCLWDLDVVGGKDVVLAENSWGTGFGKDGLCLFPLAAVATFRDVWVYTMSEMLD